jgi:hypothetical protein
MTLNLNYQQRINLSLLVGAQRGNVSEMRLFWGLQDRLNLTAEEKASIEYRIEVDPAGNEMPRWNHFKARDCAPLAFECSESEGQRLRKMLDEWPHFLAAIDRIWIEPLIEQLPAPAAAPPQQGAGGFRM